MARPNSKEYEKYDKAMNKATGWKPDYQTNAYDKADVVGKGKSCYGSGHDMSKLGEGKPHGKS